MPLLTKETISSVPALIKQLPSRTAKFVRQEDQFMWGEDTILHKDLAALAGMTKPEDAGKLLAPKLTHPQLLIQDHSDSLYLPRSPEARKRTIVLATFIANQSGSRIGIMAGTYTIDGQIFDD